MTEFEEKISKYLREANQKFKQCKSPKLKRFYYLDIKGLLDLIIDNGLNIDVESIFKRTDIIFDISSLEDKYEESFLHNYYECEKVNNRIGNLGVYLDNIYGYGYTKKYKNRMSIDEGMRLCYDFLTYYDKDISRFFKSMLDKGNIFLGGNLGGSSNLVFDGCTYSFKSQDEPFILANTFENVYFPNIMAHELIHSYIDYSSDDNTFEKNCREATNNLYEVYSRFIELVFAHYLEEKHFNQNDIDTLHLTYDNTLIDTLCNYNSYIKFFDGEMIISNDFFYSDFDTCEVYSYGGVLAYHYFEQYLNNPERAKDNITNFSLDYRNYDRKHLLNNYGLQEDNLGKSRVLVKHMKNHYKY
jgi:hypothetical protein